MSWPNQPVLTIDLDALADNWRALDSLSGRAETAAAVKADGYGLGATKIAPALWTAGCRSFFVANIEEGIALRRNLPDATIYILHGVIDREAAEAKAHNLTPCLIHLAQIRDWQAAQGGPCALQLDSGMSRLGLPSGELDTVPDGLDVRLIFSHLSCADEPGHPSNAFQLEQFRESLTRLPHNTATARKSIAATGGTLLGNDYLMDLVRCGVGLYGGHPFINARPVVTLNAPILQIRDIPPGQSVGYGWTWTAQQPARIATVPLGYADGFHRALSQGAQVWINGRPAPLAGRVSMDLITIDISAFPEIGTGTQVEIIGPNQTIDQLAAQAGTIGYEMLTSLGSRYARRYKGGEIV